MGCVVNKPLPEPVTDFRLQSKPAINYKTGCDVLFTIPENADGVRVVYKQSAQLQSMSLPSDWEKYCPPYPTDINDGIIIENYSGQSTSAGLPISPDSWAFLFYSVVLYPYNINGYNISMPSARLYTRTSGDL